MNEKICLTGSQERALDAAQEEEKEKAAETPKKWGTADDASLMDRLIRLI